MTTEEATTVLQIASTLDESENENLTTVATILRGMLREIQRTGNENTQLRADLNKMTDERNAWRSAEQERTHEADKLRAAIAAKMQEQFRDYVERSESDAIDLRKEIADLKRGGVVVQDVVRGVTHMGISWEVSRPGDYYWERGAWREWKADGQMANASSFAWIRPFPVRTIPADRVLGEGMVAVDREELHQLRGLESCARAVMAYDGLLGTEERNRLKRLDALRANQEGAEHE